MVRHLLLFFVYDIFDEWKATPPSTVPSTPQENSMFHHSRTTFKKTPAGVSKLNITAGHMTAGAGSSNKAAIAASTNTGTLSANVSIQGLKIDTDSHTLPATTKLGCGC